MKTQIKKLLRKFGYRVERYETLSYNKRILVLYEIFNELTLILEKNLIKGIFVECGYGYGRSFAVLSHFASRANIKIYGFDSFIGFPYVSNLDHSSRKARKHEWSVRTLVEANKAIINLGLFEEITQYELKQIIFNKNTINPIPSEKIALLHIDLDLYTGYKCSLELFWEQIVTGGIILFDEYDDLDFPGARKAIEEFCASKNLPINQIKKIGGKHYLIKPSVNIS